MQFNGVLNAYGFFVKSAITEEGKSFDIMWPEKMITSVDFFLRWVARERHTSTNHNTVSAVDRFVCASRKEVGFIRRWKNNMRGGGGGLRRAKRLSFSTASLKCVNVDLHGWRFTQISATSLKC